MNVDATYVTAMIDTVSQQQKNGDIEATSGQSHLPVDLAQMYPWTATGELAEGGAPPVSGP